MTIAMARKSTAIEFHCDRLERRANCEEENDLSIFSEQYNGEFSQL